MKTLLTRTFPLRRSAIINLDYSSTTDVLEDYPMLKKSSYVSSLFMQFCYCKSNGIIGQVGIGVNYAAPWSNRIF